MFKTDFETESYLTLNITRQERSLLAQLRLGILPIRVETGRFRQEKLVERICCVCNSGQIEDEFHFIMKFNTYKEEREQLFKFMNQNITNFIQETPEIQFIIVMKFSGRQVAKFIKKAFNKRKELLYTHN